MSSRECTCTGVCRGAGGLGSGWHCALLPPKSAVFNLDPDITAAVERRQIGLALSSLGQQLAIAAAIQRGWECGWGTKGRDLPGIGMRWEAWRPGCGWRMP